MSENEEAGRGAGRERSRCQIDHVPGKPTSSCSEPAKETVDGHLLCERHALEVKLEGQIECWSEMLFHIDLWSREASRREKEGVVRLLEVQRLEATSARDRACADLNVLKRILGRSDAPWETWEHTEPQERPTRSSLLLLPPKAARQLSRGLRRHRRR